MKSMKNKFLHGAAALALCVSVVGCSEYDASLIDPATGLTAEQMATVKEYSANFVERYGEIDPDHNWGFEDLAALDTRAVMTDKWPNAKQPEHSCDWSDKFNFKSEAVLEAEEVAINIQDYWVWDQWNHYYRYDENGPSGNVYYVPSGLTIESLRGLTLKGGDVLYNFGTIKSMISCNVNEQNGNKVATFYNAGTMTYDIQSGGRHTIINTGTLDVKNDANVGDLYNENVLILTDTDIADDVHIYSKENVEMPYGGDLKAVCDIHGTLDVTGNVKIQNKTTKYICAIKATGHVENTDGPLITSFVSANTIKFDGNPIYLLPNGYIKANTTITIPNEKCYVYGHTNSNALVEANNFEFGNKKDFTHAFSDNIFFKVNGGYVKTDNCYAMGHNHYFNTVNEYLQFDGHIDNHTTDEYALAANRINQNLIERGIGGKPECGDEWGKKTTTKEEKTITRRVMCEDLGNTYDFDFNDLVFDVYYTYPEGTTEYTAHVTVRAVGGTLPIYIKYNDNPEELHQLFKQTTAIDGIYPALVHPQNPDSVYLKFRTETANPDDIDIYVYDAVNGKEAGTYIHLPSSKKGQYQDNDLAPQKICVPVETEWPEEHQQIEDKYPGFRDWVTNHENTEWMKRADYWDGRTE